MEHPLRALRGRHKISLDELAKLSSMSKASLSRIETGQQQPNFEAIRKLIDIAAAKGEPSLTADDFINFPQAARRRAAA